MGIKCQNKDETIECRSECADLLPCEHLCTKTCHVEDDPMHLEYECRKYCVRKCKESKSTQKFVHCNTSRNLKFVFYDTESGCKLNFSVIFTAFA